MNAQTTMKQRTSNQRRGMASDKGAPKGARFDGDTFEALAEDMRSGRIPLDRITVSDPDQPNLRAIVRNTGTISYHVQYAVGDSRPYLKVGNYPEMSIKQARELTRTVLALADKGIDPQEGLHERLIRELLERGDKWKP